MKNWLFHIGTFVIGVSILGSLVMVSGITPIKASSGHWPITKWLLSYSMSRSVSTNSIGIAVPDDLAEPDRVMRGGGHFETGCAPCHGSPAWPMPRVAQQMTPTPPKLSAKIAEWNPAELFYITKHGVKFAGMPAFPSQVRDDEVWDVVAFLLTLPELDEPSYRRLVFNGETSPPANAPHVVTDLCARCHGFDAQGLDVEAFPKLAHLHRDYFKATLRAYAVGTRHSGIMEPIAARLDEEQFQQVVDYYASLGPRREKAETSDAKENASKSAGALDDAATRGRTIANDGLPKQEVGACIACHPIDRKDHNPSYPYLVGQPASYLIRQLQLMKKHQRGGTEFIELMHPVAAELSAQQMQDVAAFYATLTSSNAP